MSYREGDLLIELSSVVSGQALVQGLVNRLWPRIVRKTQTPKKTYFAPFALCQ